LVQKEVLVSTRDLGSFTNLNTNSLEIAVRFKRSLSILLKTGLENLYTDSLINAFIIYFKYCEITEKL
jgi:hypothetical protein